MSGSEADLYYKRESRVSAFRLLRMMPWLGSYLILSAIGGLVGGISIALIHTKDCEPIAFDTICGPTQHPYIVEGIALALGAIFVAGLIWSFLTYVKMKAEYNLYLTGDVAPRPVPTA